MNQENLKIVDQAIASLQLGTNTRSGVQKLQEAMKYSLSNGGKRFRPLLSLAVGQSYTVSNEKILPWALAIEMIHTYSLIHDDLPCMDNDDVRRGKPTNHKVYGEGQALLAGDGLQTEAFRLIAEKYYEEPHVLTELVVLLGECAGMQGMVGGQALDVQPEQNINLQQLIELHEMKTGALIRAACEGAAIISRVSREERMKIQTFGLKLGLAFQVADDLLDEDQDENVSFLKILGKEKTAEFLKQVSGEARALIKGLKVEKALNEFVQFNEDRKQ